MRIVVLGGGVVGVTTAYQLQRDGHEVVVIERNPEVASGASFGNAGMIAPGHSFVWSSPRAPIILAKSLALKDQALRFRLSADLRLYAWTWGFLKECTAAKARRNTLLKHRLAAYSQTVLDRVVAEEAIDYDRNTRGIPLYAPQPAGAGRRRRTYETTGVGRPGDQGAQPRPGDRARARLGPRQGPNRGRDPVPD